MAQPEEIRVHTPPADAETQRLVERAWARKVDRLHVGQTPPGATNLNVDGRQVSGPLQGFGQLWQKTFRVRLAGVQVAPQEVIEVWKANFPRFHAENNKFYPSSAGIEPGEVVLINAVTPGGPVSTGMLVLYVDELSFTLMTPEGHPATGWVTFSAFEQDGVTTTQVQTMARANDPMYEAGFVLLGSKMQDQIWEHVLTSLAAHYGLKGQVTIEKICLDARRQWSQVKNVWQNAVIRTVIYNLGAPVRWARRQSTPRDG